VGLQCSSRNKFARRGGEILLRGRTPQSFYLTAGGLEISLAGERGKRNYLKYRYSIRPSRHKTGSSSTLRGGRRGKKIRGGKRAGCPPYGLMGTMLTGGGEIGRRGLCIDARKSTSAVVRGRGKTVKDMEGRLLPFGPDYSSRLPEGVFQ